MNDAIEAYRKLSKGDQASILRKLENDRRVMVAKESVEGVTDAEMDYMVAIAEQHMMINKKMMNWESALIYADTLGIKNVKLETILKSDVFRERLRLRGMFWPAKWKKDKVDYFLPLTPQQVQAIQIVTDPTQQGSLKSKLEKIGVNYQVYRNWLKQPNFGEAIRGVSEDMIQDNIATVHTSVVQEASKGNMQAAKLFYEVTGRHDPMRQQSLDLNKTIGLLLEVITRYVTDVPTLKKITDDFGTVIGGGNISTGEITMAPHDPNIVDAEVIDETVSNETGPVGMTLPTAEEIFEQEETSVPNGFFDL